MSFLKGRFPTGLLAINYFKKVCGKTNNTIFLAMKLTVYILLVACLQVSAKGSAQRVSIVRKNVALKEVFKEIQKQTGYTVFCNYKILEKAKNVDVDISKGSLEELLNATLRTQGLDYNIEEKMIVVFEKKQDEDDLFLPGAALPPPATIITGKVLDENGEALVGAYVLLKGTKTGVATGEKGEFAISIPDDVAKVLLITYVGKQSVEIKLGDKREITVNLLTSIEDKQEVIIVGYGSQKRENLTGSVGTVKSERLADRPTASPATLLQGLAPGVTVMQSGGYPGAGASIKIREVATWQGSTDPLYVIDGVIRNASVFASLNPSDIDNLSLLKDAASASIYGMQAGNGVILVTTKRGNSDKTQISYNGSYTTNKPTVKPPRMNAFEAYTFANKAFAQKGLPANDPTFYSDDELEYFKTHSYDWVDETWRDPWNTNHVLSMSGGAKNVRYYVSGGYLSQTGSSSNKYNKYNLLAKLDGQINSSLSFTLDVNASWDKGDRPYWAYDYGDPNLSNIYNRLLMVTPGRPAFINGLPVGNFDNTNTANLAEGAGGYIRPYNSNISPTFQLKYNIPGIKGLSAKGMFAYNTYNGYTKTFANAPYIYYFKTAGQHNHIITDELDSARTGGYKILDQAQTAGAGASQVLSETWTINSNYQLDFMLNYNRVFGEHNISAFVAYEQLKSWGKYITGKGNYFDNLNFQEFNGASTSPANRTVSGNQQNLAGQASYFGRIDYNYANKYMLGVTFRADGSYIFPPENRWGYFPAASAAWNISNENFFAGLRKTIDYMKLRFSYGITGSNNTAAWQWQQNYTFNSNSGVYLGNGNPPSTVLGGTINPNITWEKNRNYDLGLDVSMPNRLISATIDLWAKKTKDILGQRNASIPSTVGASLPAVNYGKASAKGIEIAVSHENKIGNVFYRVGANWSTSTNKYIEVDQAASVRDPENKIGKPVAGWITGYVSEGIIRTQADVDAILSKNGAGFTIFGNAPKPGMLLYKDIRGPLGQDKPDGKIDGNDAIPLSFNGIPRVNYGLNFTVGWKGLDVTAIFAGIAKYDIMPTDVYVRRPLPGNNNLKIWQNAWTPETAATADMPSPVWNDWQIGSNAEVASTFWMNNGAFLRLKSLIVNYNLPQAWFRHTQLQNARIYFSGENLHQWNHTGYYDPERGGDFRQYPLMKSFTFGASVNF
ncbi:TonB-dependent receptor [Danxiaibacter flavus]|uniref:TonB-dependent receptor n=1 Tax=Danxiaibacter flavus TaxID=3049108 RepID=A0ABV3ZLC2_9BACT|nr:TonB-dependent receptor [Chitinophagaceae bacterium DXS]